MPCCAAFKCEEALDVSAHRWAKMLVRRQAHDLEIIVAVAGAGSGGKAGSGSKAGSGGKSGFRRSTNKDPHREVQQSPGCPSVGSGRLRQFRIAVARARNSRLVVRLERAGAFQISPVNLLLTITPQHSPLLKSRPGPWSEDAIDRSSWGERGLVGLQGVTSCRYLVYDPEQICCLSSFWRFSARLAWVFRSRSRSSGFVPDRYVACVPAALVLARVHTLQGITARAAATWRLAHRGR